MQDDEHIHVPDMLNKYGEGSDYAVEDCQPAEAGEWAGYSDYKSFSLNKSWAVSDGSISEASSAYADTSRYRIIAPQNEHLLHLLNECSFQYLSQAFFDTLVANGVLEELSEEELATAAEVAAYGYIVKLDKYYDAKESANRYLYSAIDAYLLHNYNLPDVIYNTLLFNGTLVKKI